MQSSHATPQIFINGRILDANNFDSNEMFIKVLDIWKKWEIILGVNHRLIEGNIKGETTQTLINVFYLNIVQRR